jgi:allantoate deiminase
VNAIAGQSRLSFTFQGKAAHAGTTPMHLRKDALAAAAEWIVSVEQTASVTPGLVATVGQIECQSSAANVIPASARCSLDIRHADDRERETALHHLVEQAEKIAARRKIHFTVKKHYDQPATQMDRGIVALASEAIARAGFEVTQMTSGAGHDAMILAQHLPTGMIFLRTPGGISHHPDESVLEEDVNAALKAGILFLERFDQELVATENSNKDQPIA